MHCPGSRLFIECHIIINIYYFSFLKSDFKLQLQAIINIR